MDCDGFVETIAVTSICKVGFWVQVTSSYWLTGSLQELELWNKWGGTCSWAENTCTVWYIDKFLHCFFRFVLGVIFFALICCNFRTRKVLGFIKMTMLSAEFTFYLVKSFHWFSWHTCCWTLMWDSCMCHPPSFILAQNYGNMWCQGLNFPRQKNWTHCRTLKVNTFILKWLLFSLNPWI